MIGDPSPHDYPTDEELGLWAIVFEALESGTARCGDCGELLAPDHHCTEYEVIETP